MGTTPKRGPGRPRATRKAVPKRKAFSVPPLITRLDDDLRKRASELIAAGHTNRQAAATLGVPPTTFNRWVSEGQELLDAGELESPQAQLAHAVNAAKVYFETGLIELLEHELGQGLRASERLAWVSKRLAFSAPSDWTERAFAVSGGALSEKEIAEALVALQEKLTALLGDEEEDAAEPPPPDPDAEVAG